MKPMKIAVLVLLASGVATTGVATTGARAAQGISIRATTAGELAELCAANPKEAAADAKINFCHGFAQGAIDVARQALGDKRLFCLPSSPPTRTATLTEFVGWVRSMPDRRRLSSTAGLFQFLGERFPCK